MTDCDTPVLERLTRRLADCPPIILESELHLPAIIHDLYLECCNDFPAADQLRPFRSQNQEGRRHRQLAGIACWLLYDACFHGDHSHGKALLKFLKTELAELAQTVNPLRFVQDSDRREELVRRSLRAIGIVPVGESPTFAADRLLSLDSVERLKILAGTKAAEERARKLRQEMAAKRAREAAARVTGE